jgi:hypothetical protein
MHGQLVAAHHAAGRVNMMAWHAIAFRIQGLLHAQRTAVGALDEAADCRHAQSRGASAPAGAVRAGIGKPCEGETVWHALRSCK